MLYQVEGVTNPFKFADGYLDASGYYQFGERYYDPSLGRWTQQDPVGGSLGDLNAANRYTYANDDPVNVVDPSGAISGPGGAAVILGLIAALCAAAAFFLTGTIIGIPVAILFGGCAAIATV